MEAKEIKQRELIKKHIEGWERDIMRNSSIASFAESGKVSGGFFTALKAMMDEYADYTTQQQAEKPSDDVELETMKSVREVIMEFGFLTMQEGWSSSEMTIRATYDAYRAINILSSHPKQAEPSKWKTGQNLFDVLYDVCEFKALDDDMVQVINAVLKDNGLSAYNTLPIAPQEAKELKVENACKCRGKETYNRLKCPDCAPPKEPKGDCDKCKPVQGMYLGTGCPECKRPFRAVIDSEPKGEEKCDCKMSGTCRYEVIMYNKQEDCRHKII